jgi:hypothetical protein
MKNFLYTLFLLGCISFLAWGGARLYATIQFGIYCEAFLRHSADAVTLDEAKTQLQFAIDYCEESKLTSGSTSLLYPTDDEDIAIWYMRLQSSWRALDAIQTDASQAEKNAALTKLRKTLIDVNSRDKNSLLYPDGISLYPYNKEFSLWGLLSLILLVFSRLKLDKHWYP